MDLTIILITSRFQPKLGWFIDSLNLQRRAGERVKAIVVSSAISIEQTLNYSGLEVMAVNPKPTVWQGKHRLTKDDWWAAANARNTGICLCDTEWLAFLDDRCVLLPGWMDSIREAHAGKYAVFGSYEKRTDMTVESGVIKNAGIVIGEDHRHQYVLQHRNGAAPTPAPGEWAFGCTLAMPLEWALKVNGYDETCDGMGMEDVIFGLMLQNNGFDLRFDYRMKIIEDRTPDNSGPVMVKRDKGVSPNDKSHAMLENLRKLKQSKHPISLKSIRRDLKNGVDWPAPWGPETDFWDGQPVREMVSA